MIGEADHVGECNHSPACRDDRVQIGFERGRRIAGGLRKQAGGDFSNLKRSLRRRSSVGESARLIIERSAVRVCPPLHHKYITSPA